MTGSARNPSPLPAPGCPDTSTLQRFLSGRLDEAEAENFERHLESCPSCLERLGACAADDRGLSGLRGCGLELATADEPETVTALIQRLCRPVNPVSPAGLLTPGNPETRSEAERPVAIPETASAPVRLGRYRVLRPLGAGGMGAVYLAEDPELGRLVAVKVPRFLGPPEAQAASRQRFLREARAAAAVRHPHVCPIYDVGEEGTTPYVVMAFIEGRSLADRLAREGRVADPRAAVDLAAQVAEGLAAVHDRGLVHRDLKPSNILLDASGDAFLSDFGLARRQDDADRMTATGALVGTLCYMAPEQADAVRFGPATARTDLFSLGVVLYEMLTGRLPFEAKDRTGLLYQIVHDAPPPPRQFRPDLDPRLEAVILKALAKNPAERWPDCRAFAHALASTTRGDGTCSTAPVKPSAAASHAPALETRPHRKPWHSRRVRLVAMLLASVLIVVGGFLVWDANKRPDEVSSPPDSVKREPDPISKPVVEPALRTTHPGATKITNHSQSVHGIAFSPTGTLLATAGKDKSLYITEVATGKTRKRIPLDAEVYCLAFSPNGTLLASGGADRAVTLRDVETWEPTGAIPDASPAALEWIAFAPDGRTLATVGHNQTVAVLWDVNTRKRSAVLEGHTDRVHAVAFSPDSQTVATVSDDRTVRLWETATGRPKGSSLKAHVQPVTCVAFSQDGTKLATGSEDKTIVVWDVASGRTTEPTLDANGPVVYVGWTPDGRIVSKTFSDAVSLWNPAVDKAVIVREAFSWPLVRYGVQHKDHTALTRDARILAFRDCYWTRQVHLLDLSKFIDAPK
jgi:serine/threonine protein kinase